MTDPTVVHSTFVIERRFALPPARVFAAFADPALKRRWYVDNTGNEVLDYALDFRQGGSERTLYKMGEKTPMPGVEMGSEATYEEIQPDRRIVFAQTMSMAGRRFSAALITFEFLAHQGGSVLFCTHQGAFFEGSDGPAMREHGWNALIDRLAGALAD